MVNRIHSIRANPKNERAIIESAFVDRQENSYAGGGWEAKDLSTMKLSTKNKLKISRQARSRKLMHAAKLAAAMAMLARMHEP